jgi:hypothetical protein
MALTTRKRRELKRRQRLVRTIEAYLERDDVDEPKVIDEGLAKALRTSLWVAMESEQTFRRLLVSRRALSRTSEVDYLCDSIQAALEAFDDVKAMARVLRGAQLPSPRVGGVSLRNLLMRHGQLLKKLSLREEGLVGRMSTLVSLNQIELIFFSHMW